MEKLWLSFSAITKLPSSIGRLQCLRVLGLLDIKSLLYVPQEICDLSSCLEKLYLEDYVKSAPLQKLRRALGSRAIGSRSELTTNDEDLCDELPEECLLSIDRSVKKYALEICAPDAGIMAPSTGPVFNDREPLVPIPLNCVSDEC